MTDCIFCKIIAKEIPADIVLETDDVLVFRDLNPKAPTHMLAIPKRHIASIDDMHPEDAEITGKLFLAAKQIAEQEGLTEKGYRVVMNCGADAGQTVFHNHLHIMGGRHFSWPPG